LIWTGIVHAREISRANDNLLIPATHGGDGSAWGQAQCAMCHPMSVIHREAPDIRPIVERKGYQTCAGCHGSNGTAEPRRCTVCHNAQDLPASPLASGALAHDFSVKKSRKLSDRDCAICHINADMDGRFEPRIDLTHFRDKNGASSASPSIADFCLRCHNRDHQQKGFKIKGKDFRDPLIAMEDNYNFIDKHGSPPGTGLRRSAGLREPGYRYGPGPAVDCTDCHAMHGTHNERLVIDTSRQGVSKMSKAFRNAPYKVDVELLDEVVDTPTPGATGANVAQLCALCHAMTADPPVQQGGEDAGNGLRGVHAVSGEEGDCKRCHYHGAPFDVGGM
jgi:hypothetical protein